MATMLKGANNPQQREFVLSSPSARHAEANEPKAVVVSAAGKASASRAATALPARRSAAAAPVSRHSAGDRGKAAGSAAAQPGGALVSRRPAGRRKPPKASTAAAARAAARRNGAGASAGSAAGKSAARRKAAGSSAAVGAEQSLPLLRGTLSVIISARNEEHTLPRLLKQVGHLNPAEIIVVLNGCSDNSFQHSRLCRQATVVHCPESAGHDVGRAIGAKLSRGDILLFLDGDMVIPALQLAAFAAAVDGGIDVALNDLDALLPPFGLCDDVTRSKLYLNAILGRSDLGVSSMTAVPHALSRRALDTIGYRELMVPPKAQAISIMEGLRVEKAGTVNVIKHNRLRQGNIGAGNAMEQLITGDHAEALLKVLKRREASGLLSGENLQEQRRQMAAWRNRL